MSEEAKLYRCMGRSHCKHIPGTCTATNTEYQARIKQSVLSHPPTTNPVVDHETGNVSYKLRDAVDVYIDACNAFGRNKAYSTAYKAAAAVIEADRQATRAALVSEIAAEARGETGSAWAEDVIEFASFIEAKWGKP